MNDLCALLGVDADVDEAPSVLVKRATAAADEQRRRLAAFESLSSLVMIADEDFNIRYMNQSLSEMLTEAEGDIKKTLPDFEARHLIGQNIDVFHKNPQHQRRLLDALEGRRSASIRLGERRMKLDVAPVSDAQGERLGTVVEWRDATVELRVQDEIDTVLAGMADGDFSRRVDPRGATDSLLQMAEAVNLIAEALGEATTVIAAVADGDLSPRMNGAYSGAFEKLKNDVNSLVCSLSAIVGEIGDASEEMKLALETISFGAGDIAERAGHQAGALEETAATMEELSANVRSNALNAQDASEIASRSTQDAEEARRVLASTVEAMGRIEVTTGKMTEIISVIDGIAFQTNLLALNAAVEAARAGEAGRGFAVVAAEVRGLAQRTSSSAADIKRLIHESGTQVAEGVRFVGLTGEGLSGILKSVHDLSGKMAEIASANEEQSKGLEEITSTVSHLDDITQRNSTLAAENVANARTTLERAAKLVELASRFRGAAQNGALFATPSGEAPRDVTQLRPFVSLVAGDRR